MDVDVEMKQLELDLGIIEKIYVTNEEKERLSKLTKKKEKLPDDVYYNKQNDTYFRLYDKLASQEEVNKLMLYKQTVYLKTIKNSAVFFVVVQCIAIIGAIILYNQLF